EFFKPLAIAVENLSGEAPKIHRHRLVATHFVTLALLVDEPASLALASDLVPLDNTDEVSRFRSLANAPAHGTEGAQRISQGITHHRAAEPVGRGAAPQEIDHRGDGGRPVEVVGIDDGKGPLDLLARTKERMGRAPRLGPLHRLPVLRN